jgi:hypothetical protein
MEAIDPARCPNAHDVPAGMRFCGQCGHEVVAYSEPGGPPAGTHPAEEPDPVLPTVGRDEEAPAVVTSPTGSRRGKVVAGSVAAMLMLSVAFVMTRSGSSEAGTGNRSGDQNAAGTLTSKPTPAATCAETVTSWTARIIDETVAGGTGTYQAAVYSLGTSSPEMGIIGFLMGPTLQRAMRDGVASATDWMVTAAAAACAEAYPAPEQPDAQLSLAQAGLELESDLGEEVTVTECEPWSDRPSGGRTTSCHFTSPSHPDGFAFVDAFRDGTMQTRVILGE